MRNPEIFWHHPPLNLLGHCDHHLGLWQRGALLPKFGEIIALGQSAFLGVCMAAIMTGIVASAFAQPSGA
jgi:hypothetical protein